MVDADHGCVEEQALFVGVVDIGAVELVSDDGRVESGGFALFGVPHCRDFGVGAVDAELVGASGVGFELDAGHWLSVELFSADDFVVRDGGLAVEVIDEHEGADVDVFADRGVDGAFVGVEVSFDEREVAFGDLAVLELLREVFVGFGVQREDHDP